MALKWFCDVTGKEVFMAPPYEVAKDAEGKDIHLTSKNFNGNTGRIDRVESKKLRYLKEKAYLVRLAVGDENIQLCLSQEGLDKVRGHLTHTWAMLEDLLPK